MKMGGKEFEDILDKVYVDNGLPEKGMQTKKTAFWKKVDDYKVEQVIEPLFKAMINEGHFTTFALMYIEFYMKIINSKTICTSLGQAYGGKLSWCEDSEVKAYIHCEGHPKQAGGCSIPMHGGLMDEYIPANKRAEWVENPPFSGATYTK